MRQIGEQGLEGKLRGAKQRGVDPERRRHDLDDLARRFEG